MSNNILRVQNLSKGFTISNDQSVSPTFKEILSAFLGRKAEFNRKHDVFWALKNISFELNRGENLGIVGLNGAGKSTLLKILLGRLDPDIGDFTLNGSAGGLIELGAGFDPEQTGRKNIYINARLLGISDVEIKNNVNKIIEFAEIGDFIDRPVKTYSSGMAIRLGFSTAIHFVKDLIICDEILAVGDFEFRQKCFKKIHELKKTKSFILVSHSTTNISLFCDKAILLHKGECIAFGKPDNVLEAYAAANSELCANEYKRLLKKHKTEKVCHVNKDNNSLNILKHRVFQESEDVRLKKYGHIYEDYKSISNLKVYANHQLKDGQININNNDKLILTIVFKLLMEPAHLRIGLPFFNDRGEMIIGPDSREISPSENRVITRGSKKFEFRFDPLPLNEGSYVIALALSNDPGYLYRDHIVKLNVKKVTSEFGVIKANHKVKLFTENSNE